LHQTRNARPIERGLVQSHRKSGTILRHVPGKSHSLPGV
jgi:hypothetical protein